MLVAAGTRAGAASVEIPTARDTHDDLLRSVSIGLEADILVLSGGVSAGKFDLVPQVLAELGVEQVFHKISLRPGKPLWFGVKKSGPRNTLVFGLPGNPVSSLVCFELFVRPPIAALAGYGFRQLLQSAAKLSHDYDHAGGRAACLPALIEGDAPNERVAILPWQGSADLATLVKANAFVRLPAEKQHLTAGTPINVLPI
jgi:molybdopterin molybdotransferase